MDIQELTAMLTEGLPEDQAKIVRDAIARDAVKAKASALRQQSELDALEGKRKELETSFAKAKEYQTWYDANFPKIQQLQEGYARYQERYGALDPNNPPNPGDKKNPPAGLSNEDIQRAIDERIQTVYGARWSDLLTSSGTLIEKHLRANRKNPIDWKKLSEIAQTKNGDLNAAYEEWDKPEAEAAEKSAREAEISKRVNEELAKRQTAQFFPAGADAEPSSHGITRRSEGQKYDRNAVISAAVTGKYEGKETVQ